jgi:HSP20 family protein
MLNTLFATDVRQTLDQFRRSVDEMFDSFYGGYQAQPPTGNGNREINWTFSPVLESAWGEDALSLRAILPGVAETDVRVSVQNNQLVIEGERKAPEQFDQNGFRQLAYGNFHTAVTLPTGLDVDHIQCRLRNGILDIQVPLSEASKPRQIPIQGLAEQKSISA